MSETYNNKKKGWWQCTACGAHVNSYFGYGYDVTEEEHDCTKHLRERITALEAELTAAHTKLTAAWSDMDILRKNFAGYLLNAYSINSNAVAEVCDTELDKSGELLRYVRELYYAQNIRIGKPPEVQP